jgi:urease subunit gamma
LRDPVQQLTGPGGILIAQQAGQQTPPSTEGSGPRVETWVSSLMLSPRETEKLVIYQIAELARRRKQRGLELNFPESIALITEAMLEAARDGKSVADVIELGKQILTRADVMPGVPEMVTLVQVEATFRTGTQLVSVANPIP